MCAHILPQTARILHKLFLDSFRN